MVDDSKGGLTEIEFVCGDFTVFDWSDGEPGWVRKDSEGGAGEGGVLGITKEREAVGRCVVREFVDY